MYSATVIAFLKSKGWKPAGENAHFYRFQPPAQFTFEDGFMLELPKNEKAITYARYMSNIAEALSELYNLDKGKLEMLFSKTLEEIKSERLLTRGMLAYA